MLCLAALVLLVVGVVVRISVAPLTLPLSGLIAGRVEAAVGAPVHIGAIGVRLEWGAVALTMDGARVRVDGASVSVGRINVLQSLTGRHVRLDGLAARLDPTLGGGEAMALPHPDTMLAGLDGALRTLLQTAAAHQLDRFEIAGGRLDLVTPGRAIDAVRVFQSIFAVIDVTDHAAVEASIAMVGANGPITIEMARRVTEPGIAMTLAAKGMTPKDFAPVRAVRRGFEMALDLSARLDHEATVLATDMSIDVGEGTVVFARDPARTLTSARLTLSRTEAGAFALRDSSIIAGPTTATLSGNITPARDETTPWAFAIASEDALFVAADAERPVAAERISATGRIDVIGRKLHVDAFTALFEDATFDAVFTFDFGAAGPTLAGAATVGPSSIATLMGAWPPVAAFEPRKAILDTVRGGTVSSGALQFALTPLELDGDPETSDMIDGGLSVDLAFHDVTATTPDVPLAVQRARGAMRLRDKALSVRLDGGVVAAGEGGAMAVSAGALSIPQLGAQPARAALNATVEGPASAVVVIAERLKVPQLAGTDLSPADVTGAVSATVALQTPLGADVPDSARDWSIDATLTNAGATKPIGGQRVTNANVEVLVNRRRLAARGRAELNGLAIDINYSEVFDGERSGAARFVLTEKDRRQQGFDLGEAVGGPIVITVEQGPDGKRLFTADLAQTVIAIPGLEKAAGKSLTAVGAVEGEPPALTISGLEVVGGGIQVEGTVETSPAGLERADLRRFALSAGDDARLTVRRNGKRYDATLAARRFDARRFLDQAKASGTNDNESQKPGVPFSIDALASSVRISDEHRVADFAFALQSDGTTVRRLSASGKVDDVNAGSFAVELGPAENGTRRLQADITALGRVLGALDVYGRMRGGRTTVDARIDVDGLVTGRVRTSDFVLANEKTLEDLIRRSRQEADRLRSETAPLSFARQNGVDGMSFDRLVVDFTKRNERVRIDEAILSGPILGGTATGAIDLKRRTILLNGTLIPAYGVNNLFGRLPLFGEILGGGSKGGLFGVTFRMVGTLDNPQLIVNPMSAIAPGIFRRIFEFR
ncbi:MAG: AsmA-like C-terminal region-containing protein [Pseudomonadota bacterium]